MEEKAVTKVKGTVYTVCKLNETSLKIEYSTQKYYCRINLYY